MDPLPYNDNVNHEPFQAPTEPEPRNRAERRARAARDRRLARALDRFARHDAELEAFARSRATP